MEGPPSRWASFRLPDARWIGRGHIKSAFDLHELFEIILKTAMKGVKTGQSPLTQRFLNQ